MRHVVPRLSETEEEEEEEEESDKQDVLISYLTTKPFNISSLNLILVI